MTILEFINDKSNNKDRDKKILFEINKFFAVNSEGLNDGLIDNFIVMGNQIQAKFMSLYGFTQKEWRAFSKENKTLGKEYKILDNPLTSCFLVSYHDTKNPVFIDMIYLLYGGSKFSHYFPYRDSSVYKNKMKYVLEYKVNANSFISTSGSLYGAFQMSRKNILGSANMQKRFDNLKDSDILYIIGYLRSSVNQMIKRLKNSFESVKDEDSYLYTGSDVSEDDGGESGDIVETSTNKQVIDKIKYFLDNANIIEKIDYNLMNGLQMTSLEIRFVTISLIKETELFDKLLNMTLEYYVNTNYKSLRDMKINLVNVTMKNKGISKEWVDLRSETEKKAFEYLTKYKMEKGKPSEMKNVKQIKDYYFFRLRRYAAYVLRKLLNKVMDED